MPRVRSESARIPAMSRAERLLGLMQVLRRHRHPVSGAALANELGVSIRTLYRDIASLQAQGASIDGAPGLGYVLRPGFVLPPLMFSVEEVEALALGSRWVADRADERLGSAARNALAKIAAVLPPELRHDLDSSALIVGPGAAITRDQGPAGRTGKGPAGPPGKGPAGPPGDAELVIVRESIRAERKVRIAYRDTAGKDTQRTIWPFALGFFDRVRVVVAWCELRESIRHFRTDRILALTASDIRYPRRRQALLKEWRQSQGIAAP